MSDDRHRQSRPRNRGVYPCGLARWHSPPGLIPATVTSPSTFLGSLRSRPVTALRRYYGRSDSRPPDSWTLQRNACSTCGQVSLIHALGLATIPSPTTGASPRPPSHTIAQRSELAQQRFQAGLRSSSAGSPYRVSRIEFVNLRTGRSPPAAPHPVLRRRSCRLVTVWRWIVLERTFTSLTKCAFRRTDASPRSA